MTTKTQQIIDTLDRHLETSHKEFFTAVEAAAILDRLGILKDSTSRRGLPLRNKLRAGEIPHAYQIGVYWHIPYSGKKHKTILRDNFTENLEDIIESTITKSHKLLPLAQAIAAYLEMRFKKPAKYKLEYSPSWLTAVPVKEKLEAQWSLVRKVYVDLTNDELDLDEQIKQVSRYGSQKFDIWFDDPYFFAVEFDEDQHFNQFRKATLNHYGSFDCGINLTDYRNYCNVISKPGTSGFQRLKSPDPLFPPMLPGEKQDNRIRQRAYRDFLKDLLPVAFDNCQTVRIPYHLVNKKKGFTNVDCEQIVTYIDKHGLIS